MLTANMSVFAQAGSFRRRRATDREQAEHDNPCQTETRAQPAGIDYVVVWIVAVRIIGHEWLSLQRFWQNVAFRQTVTKLSLIHI